MFTKSPLIDQVLDAVAADPFWEPYLNDLAMKLPPTVGVHLGIFVEPYLRYILDGQKVVDSRFSVHRNPPFGAVNEGDVLLLKKAGGPIVGVSQVGSVWEYELDAKSFSELRSEFAEALCVQDPAFWENRATASFATLMCLKNVRPIQPLSVEKRDRRGWVVLRRRSRQLLLWENCE